MKGIALLIASALATWIVVFSARNPEIVSIDLLIGKVSVAFSLALLGAGSLSALAGGMLVAILKHRAPDKQEDA
jgi:hypothetical protein